MNIPPEPVSFSENEADARCEILRRQMAAARAAVARHHADLIDQLHALAEDSGDAAPEIV